MIEEAHFRTQMFLNRWSREDAQRRADLADVMVQIDALQQQVESAAKGIALNYQTLHTYYDSCLGVFEEEGWYAFADEFASNLLLAFTGAGAARFGANMAKIAAKRAAKRSATKVATGGARSSLRQTGAGGLSRSGDDAYNSIRKSTTDVNEISRNTGIKPQNIQKVKDHLFHNEHLLDRYVKQGIPGETRRFDSSQEIADVWNRLRSGTHTKADIQLLKHETAEAWYMRKYGPSYDASHNAAQQRFPSPFEGG